MKNLTIATAAVAGLSAAVLGLAAPAFAAPSGSQNAQQTISALEAQGNRVIVNREGGASLSNGTVVSVREGAQIQEYTWDAQGDDRVLETTGRVVYVDVK